MKETKARKKKKKKKQQAATLGFQLDLEYVNHVIKLSYYFPKNTRKGKMMCLTPVTETSICTFFLCVTSVSVESAQLLALWTLF